MTTFITATAARKKFFSFLDAGEKSGQYIAVTHEGIPKLVMMSYEEFEGWQETLDILSDSSLMKSLAQARKEPLKDAIPWEKVKKKLKL